MNRSALNRLSARVIGSAIRVHSDLGPGLAEDEYESRLCSALAGEGLRFETHCGVAMKNDSLDLGCGFSLDLLVEGCLVVEVKSVSHLQRSDVSRLRACLEVANHPCGLLINFNTPHHLREGIRQVFSRELQ